MRKLIRATKRTWSSVLAYRPQAAARVLGLQLHVVHASTELDFSTVFATLVQLRAGGLLIAPDGAALALRYAVPPDLSVSRVRCGRRFHELRRKW